MLVLAGCVAFGWLPPNRALADRWTVQDTHGDAVARRIDSGADGPLGTGHQLPDLLSVTIGTWRPTNAQTDLFSGTWANDGDFFRLELVFDGLVNPPGPLGCCGQPSYDPFQYGPNPLAGYVEIDMDRDTNTGGEIDWPDLRYLGNTSRYGGRPLNASVRDRAAVDGRDLDEDFNTQPYIERSGEDFHLELVGWEISSDQIERSETSDWLFGTGETWTIAAHLLHRAHGYSQFSSACCRSGVPLGNYEPLVHVQFWHNSVSDRTTVGLVYPLTNAGSAAMTGSPTEGMDACFTNQNSVSESLWELMILAFGAPSWQQGLPEFALIAPWEDKNPDEYLDPTLWRITVLVGGSYESPQDAFFVWSDLYPDVRIGDLDGDGNITPAELVLFDAYLQSNDGNPALDGDAAVNGSIEISNFGPSFSLYDLNYDGLIDSDDRAMVGGSLMPRADYDHDGDVDQTDFAHMQSCLCPGPGFCIPGCRNADLDHDFDVDQQDVSLFVECASGPGISADPLCGRP